MSLNLILGCMFSGKSSELIRRVRMHRLLNKNVVVINHSLDQRYGECLKVTSHDMVEEKAVKLQRLFDLFNHPDYVCADSIFIDEGQFFDDIDSFVRIAIEKDNKHVTVSALDGDFRREPFMNVIKLVPYADDVVRLKALCLMCKDGTHASFSKRTALNNHEKNFVGGKESYMSVCRKHYTS